jgi:hypothetical protein
MAGQIAPKNLFNLRLDMKALVVLAKLKQRNAESIFSAIASELKREDVDLLPATTDKTSLLEREKVVDLAVRFKISIAAHAYSNG